ncbi:lipase family protein [Vibrio sp. C8]
MTIEMYNHCVLCNPEVNWLELEFRSENDEPINGLKVTITNPSTKQTHQQTTSQGNVLFSHISAGEWVVSVDTDNLLEEVEQYASRKEGEASPVQSRTADEKGAAQKKPKEYHAIHVGDVWASQPDDEFLVEHHGPVMGNYSEKTKGFRANHNRTVVLEIKALRSYMPMMVDTEQFSLVNSYTFALLAQLAYASDKYGAPDNDEANRLPEGSINRIIEQLKLKEKPEYCASTKENWLLVEIPYSEHLKANYYQDTDIGAEAYILSNDDIAIVGVRGTQKHFGNEEINKLSQTPQVIVADKVSPLPILKITEITDGVIAALNSPGYQDVVTDIDASQISPPEFGGTYVHQGFYQYAMALWKPINDAILKHHGNKKVYICGHSLGGAGALLLSSLIQETYSPSTLRLFTYGMPRAGTHSFVSRYNAIKHYRHVNNHDLVPQVPMRWMNTNPDDKSDSTSVWKYFSPALYLWDSLKERTVDNDDDNYQHHGNLVQLLTYSLAKHQPNDIKQVLLTEKQTHVSSLTLASNQTEDSYRLAKTLSEDHIDINGYVGTIHQSGLDHMMSEYIPNFKSQLTLLLNDTLDRSYIEAAQTVHSTEQRLLDTYQKLKQDKINALGMQYVTRKNPAAHAREEQKRTQTVFAIKQEIELTEKIIWNVQRVRQELETLVTNPALLPVDRLLFGDQTLDKTTIKEQLQ